MVRTTASMLSISTGHPVADSAWRPCRCKTAQRVPDVAPREGLRLTPQKVIAKCGPSAMREDPFTSACVDDGVCGRQVKVDEGAYGK